VTALSADEAPEHDGPLQTPPADGPAVDESPPRPADPAAVPDKDRAGHIDAAARERARRKRQRDAIFAPGASSDDAEERRREAELLRDVPPHHGT
jgi:hypothetical protein